MLKRLNIVYRNSNPKKGFIRQLLKSGIEIFTLQFSKQFEVKSNIDEDDNSRRNQVSNSDQSNDTVGEQHSSKLRHLLGDQQCIGDQSGKIISNHSNNHCDNSISLEVQNVQDSQINNDYSINTETSDDSNQHVTNSKRTTSRGQYCQDKHTRDNNCSVDYSMHIDRNYVNTANVDEDNQLTANDSNCLAKNNCNYNYNPIKIRELETRHCKSKPIYFENNFIPWTLFTCKLSFDKINPEMVHQFLTEILKIIKTLIILSSQKLIRRLCWSR